jgi:anti-sigma regulatory factor (Ser/Thr protein kinase)
VDVAEPRAWSYRRAWPAQPRHVADARQFVAQRLLDQGLDRHVDVMRLVVSELATNAVVHARGPFAVSVGRRNGSLTLRVTDASQQPPAGPVVSTSQSPSGRGLHIVSRLCTSWGVTTGRGGKTVWATFDLR